MVKKTIMLLILTLSSILIFPADIKFKGMVQTWFSYADQNAENGSVYGFNLRRARFKPYGTINKNIDWAISVGFDEQNFQLIDEEQNHQVNLMG